MHSDIYQNHCDCHWRGPPSVSTSPWYRIENQLRIHSLNSNRQTGNEASVLGMGTALPMIGRNPSSFPHLLQKSCDDNSQAGVSNISHYHQWVVVHHYDPLLKNKSSVWFDVWWSVWWCTPAKLAPQTPHPLARDRPTRPALEQRGNALR